MNAENRFFTEPFCKTIRTERSACIVFIVSIYPRPIKHIISADMDEMNAVFFGTESKIGRTKCVDDIVCHLSFVFSVLDIGICGTIDDDRDSILIKKVFTLTQVSDIEYITISIYNLVSCVFACFCITEC